MDASHSAMSMSKDFYLCYCDEDYDKAKYILNELEKRDLFGYFEERDGALGQTVISNIEEGLTICKKVIILVSKKSVKSDWMEYKMHVSVMNAVEGQQGNNIIPVYWNLPKSDVPLCLNHLQGAQFYNGEKFWSKLTDSINRKIKSSS